MEKCGPSIVCLVLLCFTSFPTPSDAVNGNSSSNRPVVDNLSTTTPASITNNRSLSDEIGKNQSSACQLKTVDPHISDVIRTRVQEDKVNLLEYHLVFPNHSVNPLWSASRYVYRLDTWARASSRHGQTLLSLAFNYGILSLRTLSFGTDELVVEMEEVPRGCIDGLNESDIVDRLLHLMSRDFQDTEEMTLTGEERVCYEKIVDLDGYAKFDDQCYMNGGAGELVEAEAGNFWINFLYTILMGVRIGIIFFGPLLMTSAVGTMSRKSVPYAVKLKEPLRRRIALVKEYDAKAVKAKQTVDLSRAKGFPRLRNAAKNLDSDGRPFDAQITQYDVLVSYQRLLTENRVPVGLWRSIGSAIFFCKIRNAGPFRECCTANMFAVCDPNGESGKRSLKVSWLKLWKKVGLALVVLCIPSPWYLRLWVFYTYEYDELIARKAAIAKVGLQESFDTSLIYYFTPTHWIFTCAYILYFISAILLAYMARSSEEGRFRKVIVGSFSDLKRLSWIRVLQILVGNAVWPFQKFGLVGIAVAIVYCPVVLPLTFVVCVIYWLPLTYLSFRMLFYSNRVFMERMRKRQGARAYRDAKHTDDTMKIFEASNYRCCFAESADRPPKDGGDDVEGRTEEEDDDEISFDYQPTPKKKSDVVSIASTIIQKVSFRPRRFLELVTASLLCILTLFSLLIVLSECMGCFIEIIVFTMMGIIVNAGTLLKYVSLVILVVVYSFDSFNNVEKKYLKLNKALFGEIKSRIKDLDKVTSLPSTLQENFGFKTQELNEQADYEDTDSVEVRNREHYWLINDLTLFVDNEDMPRIPKKLFDEVCQIRVAGVPGPVYLGLLFGVKQFLKIAAFIFFVFVVVLSFGDVYKISSTNQMLATLAGGFLPVILRQFMEPERPDIEIGTVSFKSKLDEIIKNFRQLWPMYDLELKEAVPEVTEAENGGGNEQGTENGNEKGTGSGNEMERNNHVEKLLEKSSVKERDDSSTAVEMKDDKRKVQIEEKEKEEEVDLLIILPTVNNDQWIDQWSDIVEFSPTGVSRDKGPNPELAAELMMS